MNKYELGIVIRADLEEQAFQAEMTRVKDLIERFEGTIDKIDEWGRRKLAYPIKKLTEGVYTFVTFTAPAGSPREVENRLRLMENVLRFLIVRKEDFEAPAAVQPVADSVVAEEPAAEPKVTVESAEEPVEVAQPVTAESVEVEQTPEPATEEPVADALQEAEATQEA